MAARPFSPGFRLSATDAAVLAAGCAGSALASQAQWWMGAVIAFAVGHFFLFCNVFRMARPFELAWTAIFVTLAAVTIATGEPGWPAAFGISLFATLALVVAQMRRPSYHGVLWQRINPGLPQWWETHGGRPRTRGK
jgi:hypothetical protein